MTSNDKLYNQYMDHFESSESLSLKSARTLQNSRLEQIQPLIEELLVMIDDGIGDPEVNREMIGKLDFERRTLLSQIEGDSRGFGKKVMNLLRHIGP